MVAHYIRRNDLLKRLGVSKDTLYRMIDDGYPKPVLITDRIPAWIVEEVEGWEKNLKRGLSDHRPGHASKRKKRVILDDNNDD